MKGRTDTLFCFQPLVRSFAPFCVQLVPSDCRVIRCRSVTSIFTFIWFLQDEPSTVDKVKAAAAEAADVAAAK